MKTTWNSVQSFPNHSTLALRNQRVQQTDSGAAEPLDQLVFHNGGTIEQLDQEGWMKVTSPQGGEDYVMGWIEPDASVTFISEEGGSFSNWHQSFPQEGGTRLSTAFEKEPTWNIAVGANGRPSVGNASLEVAGATLNLSRGQAETSVAPAVPLEWIVVSGSHGSLP